MELITQFGKRHPELVSQVAPIDAGFIGYKQRRLLSILNKHKLERDGLIVRALVNLYSFYGDEFKGRCGR